MREFLPGLLGAFLASAPFSVHASPSEGTVDFSRDIRPILAENCFHCHGPDEQHRKAKLRLDLRESAFEERDGFASIVPHQPEESEALLRILSDDPDEVMPPPKAKKVLTDEQKQLIRTWIAEGAQWNNHWSFDPPGKAEVPDGVNPIDHFIAQGHSAAGSQLTFSEPADPRILTRRLFLDLTGMPPVPEDLARFGVETSHFDPAPVIDALLASPHFGERMAVMWLDAARYGDTSVMHADGPRDMWAWRDWVVQAYNENKPYNEFGIEQLAGDLLPHATISQKVASGFNRNNATSDEGGAFPEELRVQYVVDRVRTTANVFMGLTMECAQCHDHKYDPISQREYFRFFAYFNNHSDPGMQTRNGNQAPIVTIVSPTDEKKLIGVRKRLQQSEADRKQARVNGRSAWKDWLEGTDGTDGTEPGGLKHFFALDASQRDVEADLLSDQAGVFEGPGAGKENPADRGTRFDGKTAISFEDFPDYEFKNKPFTLAAWLKMPAGAGGAVISKMDVKSNYRGWDLWLQGGAFGTHIIHKWPQDAIKVVSTEKLKPDTWQHVVVTYDGKGSADGVALYLNGRKLEHNVEQAQLKGSTKSAAPFRIGARSEGSVINGSVDDVRIYQRVLNEEEIAAAAKDPVQVALATADKERSKEQRRLLNEYYFEVRDTQYREALARHAQALREEKQLLKGSKTTAMMMADNPADKMRKTYILDRGAYDAPKKDEEILPGTPAILPPIDADAPQNRLTLARWLFNDEHPLTSRVAVNMTWQVFFGSGLVATPGDLGAQGAYPSHPELLDWLAVDFRENGWDVKRLVRQIVSSRTYQQSSRLQPSHLAVDPENKLLARAPRFRLQAEFVRDNALALSGLLVTDLGGPGVKPYQPPGLWAQVGLGGNPKFKQDHGEKLYRRSLYTYWKRSAPAPSMQIFDAPTREVCVMKRPRTNTPLQALVTLNDIQFVEAARHLAERMMKNGGDTAPSRRAYGFKLATAREPSALAQETMKNLYDKAMAVYQEHPERATELLQVGESPRDQSLPATEHAALTLVASMILNLDETLTRE